MFSIEPPTLSPKARVSEGLAREEAEYAQHDVPKNLQLIRLPSFLNNCFRYQFRDVSKCESLLFNLFVTWLATNLNTYISSTVVSRTLLFVMLSFYQKMIPGPK